MQKSPEEIANSPSAPERHQWLLDPSRKLRELLRFQTAAVRERHDAHLATHVLFVRIAEISEISTRRIIWLTWGLFGLTAGLLWATIVLLKVAMHTDERVRKIHEIAETQRHDPEKTNTSAPKIDGISGRPIRQ